MLGYGTRPRSAVGGHSRTWIDGLGRAFVERSLGKAGRVGAGARIHGSTSTAHVYAPSFLQPDAPFQPTAMEHLHVRSDEPAECDDLSPVRGPALGPDAETVNPARLIGWGSAETQT
ncbi:hypothetical protein CDD83_951 [Cordyceps sp. RAO-2017]|nr:hypothetical protein CDD83_951 [Cordyceps sp. RAO-2017]